jgi:hypothetical protein
MESAMPDMTGGGAIFNCQIAKAGASDGPPAFLLNIEYKMDHCEGK